MSGSMSVTELQLFFDLRVWVQLVRYGSVTAAVQRQK